MTIEVPEAYFPETIAFEITETGTYDGEAGKGRLLRRVFFLTLGQAGLVISPFRAPYVLQKSSIPCSALRGLYTAMSVVDSVSDVKT